MISDFTYEARPQRVVFGSGRRREVAAEVDRLGRSRAVLISGATAEIGDEVAAALGDRLAGRWDEFVQHVPVELAARARAFVDERAADVVVTVGGGSATGLAKAIALTHRLPIVAIPTTYAGSEQTPIYGLTGGRDKQTGKDPIVQPVCVVYDTELTLVLPPEVTGPSAFNALAHSVEGMYAEGHNPVTTALALEACRAIARSLPVVMERPADLAARGELLYGAYLSGVVLGATSAGLHHKIAHVLGGTYDLVHADAHSVLLPHVVAFNNAAVPDEFARLADALGVPGGDPAVALWELAAASHVPTALADLKSQHEGVALVPDDLADVARRVASEAPPNPRPVDAGELVGLLEAAFEGRRPGT